MHGIGVYSAGVGPKGLAFERFPDIKKNKKIKDLKYFYASLENLFGNGKGETL